MPRPACRCKGAACRRFGTPGAPASWPASSGVGARRGQPGPRPANQPAYRLWSESAGSAARSGRDRPSLCVQQGGAAVGGSTRLVAPEVGGHQLHGFGEAPVGNGAVAHGGGAGLGRWLVAFAGAGAAVDKGLEVAGLPAGIAARWQAFSWFCN